MATHLATPLPSLTIPEKLKKHALVAAFYIGHESSIGHLFKTSRDYFQPPPKL